MYYKPVLLSTFNDAKFFATLVLAEQAVHSKGNGYVRNNETGVEFTANAYFFVITHFLHYHMSVLR